MLYSTTDIRRFFGISRQTASNWAKEFRTYLSTLANPPEDKHKRFTPEDVEVLALVSQMKSQSATYDEIHMALKDGQRGTIPVLAKDIQPVALTGAELALQGRIGDLESELQAARLQIARVQGEKEEATRLLREQLAEKEARIFELQRQLARLEADND
jgi:DNA-binding transcriptional MerR regulator